MKIATLGVLAFAGAMIFLGFAAPAAASWRPSGSYEDSCRNIDFDGDMLTATCRRSGGGWRNTWLDNADDCDGRIVNNNGQLQCGWRGWRDRGRDYADGPRGSYQRSCRHIRMDGYTLRATCQRRDGGWRWTSLDDAYDCDGRIANFDGRLVCGRGRF
ncbi:MAG TPA: CVNH domain-containing protein [Rhizomicrobium sp.]